MARVINGNVTGVVGPVVFYTMGEKAFVKSKPRPHKKRGKPIPARSIFGIVSSCASPMITRLREGLLLPVQSPVYNHLRGWLLDQYKAYGQDGTDWPLMARGNMCQVNTSVDLRDFLMVNAQVSDMGSGKINVSIPAISPRQDMKAPAYTKQVNIKVMAVAASFTKQNRFPPFVMEQYNFVYSSTVVPAQEFVLNTDAKAGDIAFVVVAVEYAVVSKNVYSKELKDLPAAVVAVGRMG